MQGLRCQQNVENSCACESCKHCGDGFYGDGLTCTPCKDATDSGILTFSSRPTITDNFLEPVMAVRDNDVRNTWQGIVAAFFDPDDTVNAPDLQWDPNTESAKVFLENYCSSGCDTSATIPRIQLASCNSCSASSHMCNQCAGGFVLDLSSITITTPNSIVNPYNVPATTCRYCGDGFISTLEPST